MTKVIKLTDKIPRVDIEQYLASSPDDSRVCVLSERDVTIIRSYMFPGVEWSTRFVRPLGGDNYETGTEGEFSEYQEAINELDYKLSGGLTMSLETALDSIADAIEALASAQSSTTLNNVVRAMATSSVCCEQQIITQGGGVIGSTTQPIGGNDVPIFGTQDPESVPTGTYPDGYTSLEEYQLDKCQISNLIVDGIIGTLRNLGAFGVFNGVALAGLIVTAVVGIIIFPPAFIPVAAACIGFLSVEVTLLTLAANYIQDNREDWVCAIYNSDSTEAAIAVLADLIDALILAIGAESGAAFWVKQILLLLCNADTINQAMHKAAHQNYPDADCSGCAAEIQSWLPCEEIFVAGLDLGEHIAGAGCGSSQPAMYGFYARYDMTQDNPPVFVDNGKTYTVAYTLAGGTITDPYSTYGYHTYYYVDSVGGILYQGSAEQPALGCRETEVYSTTPFTIGVTLTEVGA